MSGGGLGRIISAPFRAVARVFGGGGNEGGNRQVVVPQQHTEATGAQAAPTAVNENEETRETNRGKRRKGKRALMVDTNAGGNVGGGSTGLNL